MRHYFVLFLVLGFGIFVGSFLPQIVSATQLRARLSRLDHDEHHEQKFLIAKTSQSTSTLPSENSGEMSKDGTEGSKGKQEKLAGLVRQGGDLVDRPTQLFVDGDFLKRDRRKPFMELPPEAECDPLAHVNVLISEGSEGQQGRDRTTREIEKAGFKASVRFWPSQKPEFNQGLSKELVQALGHRKIYETILLEKWACATIFEDNVTLADDFVSRVTAITVTESIPPFDVILWGWCPGKESSNLGDKSGKPQLPQLTYGQPGPCLFAYTVSLQGALLLSQANTPIKFKADEALNGAVWDPTVRPRVDKSRIQTWRLLLACCTNDGLSEMTELMLFGLELGLCHVLTGSSLIIRPRAHLCKSADVSRVEMTEHRMDGVLQPLSFVFDPGICVTGFFVSCAT